MRNFKRETRRGASLFELILVMAILTMMMGILLPAMSGGQREKEKVHCLHNLRQIMTVATIYAGDDPHTILGPVHPQWFSFQGDGYADYGGGPGTVAYMGWDDPFDPRTRPFNRLIFGKGGVVPNTSPGQDSQFELFRCPGRDRGWQSTAGFSGDPLEMERSYFEANGVSYRMNNLSYSGGVGLGIHGRSATRIPHPGMTLAFLEARAFQTLWTNDVHGWGPWVGELTGYHAKLGFFNVAYADGHAAYAGFGNGTYYEHTEKFDGLEQRGSWGRLDCLPEPPLSFSSFTSTLPEPPLSFSSFTSTGGLAPWLQAEEVAP